MSAITLKTGCVGNTDTITIEWFDHLIDWESRLIPPQKRILELVRKAQAEHIEELGKRYEENLWGDKITPAR